MDATASANASDGDIKPRVLRGLPFSSRAMASSWRWLWIDKSVPLGRYWRLRETVGTEPLTPRT